MTALLCTAPRRASAAASRLARWAPARRSAPTADADPPATAGTARTSAAGMCRPAPTAAGVGRGAPTAPLSGKSGPWSEGGTGWGPGVWRGVMTGAGMQERPEKFASCSNPSLSCPFSARKLG